ncbi:MAG TPA: SRPBCC family protein [Actinomycetota bacterium]|nr:SRPBCC family protein [Actinomycetota bacterium]
MTRLEFDMETSAPPERVIAALTDFTDRRPDIWPGLSRQWYEVYSVGETTAEIREGTGGKRSSIWARERYDWSAPGLVTWTVQESPFSRPGSFVSARVDPKEGGGSKIHVTWHRDPATLPAKLAVWMVKATKGGPVAASLKKGLRKLEQEEAEKG